MTVGAIAVLRSMSARWRAGEKDLASPYGPSPQPDNEPPEQDDRDLAEVVK